MLALQHSLLSALPIANKVNGYGHSLINKELFKPPNNTNDTNVLHMFI